jgi:uncharacterized membrane protein
MKEVKIKLWKNFSLSLLVYLIISVLGFLALALMQYTTYVPNVITYAPRNVPLWAEVILWAHIIISIALCFYFGTRLNSVGNHLLNFLSVSGGLIFGLLMMLLGSYALIFPQFSLLRLSIFIQENVTRNLYIVVAIISILPSLSAWLGMLCKSKKI